MDFFDLPIEQQRAAVARDTIYEKTKKIDAQAERIAELEQAILNALPALDDLQGEWLAVAEPYAPQQVIDIREVSAALREALKG